MRQQHSITQLIEQLQSESQQAHEEAARKIWGRYLSELLMLARRRLAPRVRQREDEEDVLQSMYKSFCIRQRRGDYQLQNRDELWKLLVAITDNKARHVAARHQRKRRSIKREDAPGAGAREGLDPLDRLAGVEPTPEEAAVMVEELEQLLKPLQNPLRPVALWKLEGYSNEEIAGADKLDCTVRTVERKLHLIRRIWLGGNE